MRHGVKGVSLMRQGERWFEADRHILWRVCVNELDGCRAVDTQRRAVVQPLCSHNKLGSLTSLHLPDPLWPRQGLLSVAGVPEIPVITVALIAVPAMANYSFHTI